MKVPLEISFGGIERNDSVEATIRERVAKLEKYCDYMTSCRVAVEQPHPSQHSHNPYRVRIDITVPPGHELVAVRESRKGSGSEELATVVREAFDAARRQLQELVERQRGEVKSRAEQENIALVVRVFRDEGYGFLKTPDGRELYFHRNSVLHDDFDRLEIGTAVRYVEEAGEKGPQASTIQLVDKPGARASEAGESPLEPPPGW
jgi:cold shock CspA family protein/ribosome-associated translation inhibitor RaiA